MFFTILFTIFCTSVSIMILAVAVSIFFYPEETKPSPQIGIHTMWTSNEYLEKGIQAKKTKSKNNRTL